LEVGVESGELGALETALSAVCDPGFAEIVGPFG
jgi:hypothetical protein